MSQLNFRRNAIYGVFKSPDPLGGGIFNIEYATHIDYCKASCCMGTILPGLASIVAGAVVKKDAPDYALAVLI